MTPKKIDVEAMRQAAPKSAFQGIALKKVIMPIIDTINLIIDGMAGTVSAEQIQAMQSSISSLQQAIGQKADNASVNQSIAALDVRLKKLEVAPATAIGEVSEIPVSISVTNLVNIGLLSTNSTNQAKAINKILAVMRTRKEINL